MGTPGPASCCQIQASRSWQAIDRSRLGRFKLAMDVLVVKGSCFFAIALAQQGFDTLSMFQHWFTPLAP
jgi:hypothetical protein